MREDIEQRLTLSTLRVYAIILREGRPIGIRELQRLAGFKSPSTAKYHIDRLLDLGLLKRVGEGYAAVGEKPAYLLMYAAFKGVLLPKILPLGVFLLVYSIVVSLLEPSLLPYMAVACLIGLLLIYESIRLLKLVPWRRSSASNY